MNFRAAVALKAQYTGDCPMRYAIAACLWLTVVACTPTVAVKAPDEPITINLNVKIEHEIRVKVDKELDDLFDEDSDLF